LLSHQNKLKMKYILKVQFSHIHNHSKIIKSTASSPRKQPRLGSSMQFGWVSNTHSLSHATKLRKKSHEEIQLTTKTKTQIKALECFLQENCLEIKPLHDDSNNKENLKNKWRLIQIPYSFSSNKCIRNPLTVLQFTFKANYKKPGKIPNNPQETDQLWNPISYQN